GRRPGPGPREEYPRTGAAPCRPGWSDTSYEILDAQAGNVGQHKGQRPNARNGRVNTTFYGAVCQEDDIGLLVAVRFLEHGPNRNTGIRQYARDIGQHTRFV